MQSRVTALRGSVSKIWRNSTFPGMPLRPSSESQALCAGSLPYKFVYVDLEDDDAAAVRRVLSVISSAVVAGYERGQPTYVARWIMFPLQQRQT